MNLKKLAAIFALSCFATMASADGAPKPKPDLEAIVRALDKFPRPQHWRIEHHFCTRTGVEAIGSISFYAGNLNGTDAGMVKAEIDKHRSQIRQLIEQHAALKGDIVEKAAGLWMIGERRKALGDEIAAHVRKKLGRDFSFEPSSQGLERYPGRPRCRDI